MGDQGMPEGSQQPDGQGETLLRTGGMGAVEREMEVKGPCR
jgi:hypothetical protein